MVGTNECIDIITCLLPRWTLFIWVCSAAMWCDIHICPLPARIVFIIINSAMKAICYSSHYNNCGKSQGKENHLPSTPATSRSRMKGISAGTGTHKVYWNGGGYSSPRLSRFREIKLFPVPSIPFVYPLNESSIIYDLLILMRRGWWSSIYLNDYSSFMLITDYA